MKKIILALLISFFSSIAFAQMAVDLEPLKGDILSTTVTVTDSATPIPGTALTGRKTMIVKNTTDATVYIGGSTVSSANGIPLLQYDTIYMDAGEGVILYGITATTADIRVLEIR